MLEPFLQQFLDWCLQHMKALIIAAAVALGAVFWAALRKRVEADVNSLAGFMAGALVFYPLQFLRRFITLYVSFDYAKRQLELPATKHLPVPARDDVNLETDSIFVPLTLEQNGKPYDHSTVLRVGNRLRIVGDPGSGKTTILKRMLRDQCKQLARWRAAHQALFPVMIELRSLKPPTEAGADLGEWLLKVIEEKVKSFHGYEMGSRVDTFMTGQGLLVLFDGADEIGTDQYGSVEMALNAVSEKLAAKSANNVILMTMRAQFHLQVRRRFEQQYPAVLHVKPFSPSDIYALLNKWPFPASGAEHAARIYADLSDRPSLRELCTNPLVVSMYIADDQRRIRNTGGGVRNISVPDSRADFYKDVVEELLLKRREAQDGAQTQGRVRVRQQREQFFGSLAYHHLLDGTQPANVIPFADAIDIVKHVFEVDAIESDAAQSNAERILRSLSKDTGLFSEEKEGEQLRFIHLSFIEYFAALYAIEYVNDGWSLIVNKHADNIKTRDPSLVTRLRELFPFAVRLCHFKDRAGHLGDVCRVFSDELLQASCFLETKIYQGEPWLTFSAESPGKLRALLPQLRRAEDAQRFYTIVAVLRDAEAHGCGTPLGTTDSLDEFFRELLASDRSVAFQAIQLMARFDAVAALRLAEMCGLDLLKDHPAFLIKNAEQPAFLGQILQRSMSNREDRCAWLVYAALAGLFVAPARADLLTKEPVPALAAGDPRLVSFWAKIALRKETLFAQVLANIDDAARSSSWSTRYLPYQLWRFAKDIGNHRYLFFARKRYNFAKILALFILSKSFVIIILFFGVIAFLFSIFIYFFIFDNADADKAFFSAIRFGIAAESTTISLIVGTIINSIFIMFVVFVLFLKNNPRLDALPIYLSFLDNSIEIAHVLLPIIRLRIFFCKSTLVMGVFDASKLTIVQHQSVQLMLEEYLCEDGRLVERRLSRRFARREERLVKNIRYIVQLLDDR